MGTFAASHVMSRMQGWNPDPFGRFDHRYFSDGTATSLVRTGHVEARDEPGVRGDEQTAASLDVSRDGARIGLRPYVYERLERRRLGFTLLAVAFVLPFLAWELLVTSISDRLFGAGAFAIVAATLAMLVHVFRGADSPRARLSACDSTPSTSSTEHHAPSR